MYVVRIYHNELVGNCNKRSYGTEVIASSWLFHKENKGVRTI